MSNRELSDNKMVIYLLILISFMLFSFINIFLILCDNRLYFMQDSFFHMGRIIELMKSQYIFPKFAMNTFNFSGSSVMTMYPYILLYPIVILFKLIKSLKYTLLISYFLMTFITFIISFFSSLALIKSRLVSYIFSLIYTCSGEFMVMYFYSVEPDIGVYFSTIFLPLALFGFICLFKYNNYLMFFIGMTFIAYSNVISIICVLILLCIFCLINLKDIRINVIKSIVKASILILIFSSLLWIPMLKLMMMNSLYVPSNQFISPIHIRILIHNIVYDDLLGGCQSLTIFSWIGCIVGLIFFKRIPILMRKLYVFSIFVIVISSNLIPWKIISKIIIIRHIQSTIRFLVVPQLFLEFILAYCLAKIINNNKNIILSLLFIIIILMLQSFVSQYRYLSNYPELRITQNQIINKSINIHNIDYWPRSSINLKEMIYRHYGMYKYNNLKYLIYVKPLGNGVFYLKSSHDIKYLQLPFLYYYGNKYKVYLNGHSIVSYPSKNQLMIVNGIHKGLNKIHIYVQ